MNIFFRKGINFRSRNTLLMDGKILKNFKRGLYSTSFNSDIVPLVHLHLAKQKKSNVDQKGLQKNRSNADVKQKILQKHRNDTESKKT